MKNTSILIAALVAGFTFTFLYAQDKKEISKNEQKSVAFGKDSVQEFTIVVGNEYEPSIITVKKGKPVKLLFDYEKKSCAGTVVIKDFKIKQKLELGKKIPIEFTPTKEGEYSFHCSMKMYKGIIVVK